MGASLGGKACLLLIGAVLAGRAEAQDIQWTPLADARLRWEDVDQAGMPRHADAVTARLRSGVSADKGPFEVLVESEETLAIVEHYDSQTNGRTGYPIVADPQNIEINRALLRYQAGDVAATAGRQLLELADQRWVGSSDFRQNQRTFDAARVELGNPDRFFADVSYAWSERTGYGIQGSGAHPQSIGGDNVFAIAGARTPAGLLTGFAYLVDQDDAAVDAFGLSSQTYGIRLVGKTRLGPVKLDYSGSWARQSDWHRNPNHYAATFWAVEAKASAGVLALTAGQEVLGADDGRALTSVQTPLASLFKFEGWAEKFTVTPPNGLRDLYGQAVLTFGKPQERGALSFTAAWHRFRSDRLGEAYGHEWDYLASYKHRRTTLSARYARYRANSFETNTSKFWLEVDWSLRRDPS